jgi:hypothetical protein
MRVLAELDDFFQQIHARGEAIKPPQPRDRKGRCLPSGRFTVRGMEEIWRFLAAKWFKKNAKMKSLEFDG